MKPETGIPLTPSDLCILIAHETAALLYDAGADGIPSAETLRSGLITYAASAGLQAGIDTHLAWIDSECRSAQEFEHTGEDAAPLLALDKLHAVPDASMQLEAIWELFRTAVRLPYQQDRKTMLLLADELSSMGGLPDILSGTAVPEGPYLTTAGLREELTEVSAALQNAASLNAVNQEKTFEMSAAVL